jgi:hypothetical protein
VLALDKTSVNVGDAFHLILTTHVDERIAALDNVVLAELVAGWRISATSGAARARQEGHRLRRNADPRCERPGDRTIGPATLRAVDAQTGRPRNIRRATS